MAARGQFANVQPYWSAPVSDNQRAVYFHVSAAPTTITAFAICATPAP
jgi:hypothetical protein